MKAVTVVFYIDQDSTDDEIKMTLSQVIRDELLWQSEYYQVVSIDDIKS